MKPILFSLLVLLSLVVTAQKEVGVSYTIDATQNLDTFFVELKVDGKLDKSTEYFQFAATAPGTYQTMNIGRLVSDFKAFDKKGRALPVERVDENRYNLSRPDKIQRITYKVAETFDTSLEEFPIYLMAGSSIEMDHTLINAHTTMGYFEGYQNLPLRIRVIGQPDWVTGSALTESKGYYQAENFDHAVDSPILSGFLSYADTLVGSTPIRIFTYSQNELIQSDMLLSGMSEMLEAALDFLIELPVDRYTFLYHFEPDPPGVTGAWEHSFSSEYVMWEKEPTVEYLEQLADIASHEFFHIVTPLNIHSEVVEDFNFTSPRTSMHLWLYEGVTEWASKILLFRGGKVDLETYLTSSLQFKILVSRNYFDDSWSLKKLAEESFDGGEASKQYGNIYFKGALVAGLLDIRLLELSEGQYGLRELILDLVEKYGKGKPVNESTFFDDIAQMTYPEIRSFFDAYVMDNQPLPFKEYFSKIGLELSEDEQGKPVVTKMAQMTEDQQRLFEAWSVNLEVKQK